MSDGSRRIIALKRQLPLRETTIPRRAQCFTTSSAIKMMHLYY
jgi:hypothetical protein